MVEEGIRDQLEDNSLGAFEAPSGWSIHIGKAPTSPDTAIVIAMTGGPEPDPKWLLDFSTYQIRVRGEKGSYKSARDKAKAIKDLFLGFTSADVNGDRWVSITMPTDIAFIGYDQNERPSFVVNLRMIIEPAVPALTNREPL